MTFIARPQGHTLKRAQESLHAPAPADERFDPNFIVTMQCDACGKLAVGPRSLMREAIAEHKRSDCSARRTKTDEPQTMRLYYPRQ
jgi:hypothetical protein